MKGRRTLRGSILALLCAMLLLACVPLGAAETATPSEPATPGESTCMHPDVTKKVTISNKRAFAPVDEMAHSYTADECIERVCKKCGWHLPNIVTEGKTITEAHAFDANGRCTECGYCKHTNVQTTVTEYPETTAYVNNGDNHTRSWTVNRLTVCQTCGAQISDVNDTESVTENHTFFGGTCVCGAACPHEHTVQSGRHVDEESQGLVSYNDEVHVLRANIVASIYCEDCGQKIATNAVVETVEIVEKHDYDEEGNCWIGDCGATNSCPHNGTTHKEIIHTGRTSNTATKVDAIYHSYPGIEVTGTICDLCGSVISEEKVQKDVLVSHSIENGRCTANGCGFEGTGCEHTNKKVELEDTLQRNQKSLGHDEHEYIVDVVEVTSCPDCGYHSQRIVEVGVRRTGEHVFVNGVCTICGGDEHPNRTAKQVYGQMDVFEPIDEHTHSFLADVYEVVTCADCGTVLSRKLVASAALQTGKHTFGENGRCEYCLYCTHKTTLKRTIDMEGSERYEDSGDGKTHIKIWDVLEETYCALCGVVVNQRILDDSQQENHDHSNCTCACGAVHHANTKVPYQSFDMDKAELISYNEAGHTLKTDIVGDEICQDCFQLVVRGKVIEADVTFWESHELDSEGKCKVCGYKPTCAHEHIGTDEEYNDNRSTASAWDEEGHTVVAEKYVYTYCEDCGALLRRETMTTEPIKLPHRFVKDVETCIVDGCEAKNECTHSNLVEETYDGMAHNYVSLGSGEHQYVANVMKRVYCQDCGVQMSRETVQENAVLTEEHAFMQGVCAFCGEKEPAPTPTPTPTPTPAPTATPEPDIDYEPTNRPNRTPAPTARPVVTAVPTAVPTIAPTAEPTKKPIVETLFEAVAEAQAEGKDVEVEIVGAQEIMTQEEYTELKTLTVQEQVLVTLKSVGLDEVVQAAVAAMNVAVSGEAQSLMDKVGTRMEAMTAEEKAAYEDKLAEYFPVTERVIGGVTVRTFTIDMKVVVDGFERVERYQFYLDENGEWIFEKVDLASFGRA